MKTPQSRIEKRSIPEPNSGCWLWLGTVAKCGYGYMGVGQSDVRAHRFSYEAYRGPIPDELVIDHLCRNKICVNPDHLEVVTQAENVRRGNSGWNLIREVTHCVQGHAFDEVNTAITPRGTKRCRVCNAEWMRNKRAKAKLVAA